jgi:hypothetical protein
MAMDGCCKISCAPAEEKNSGAKVAMVEGKTNSKAMIFL